MERKNNEKAVSLDNSSRWISRLHCRGGGRITSIQSWQRVCRAVLARGWHDPDVRCVQFESLDATAGLMWAVLGMAWDLVQRRYVRFEYGRWLMADPAKSLRCVANPRGVSGLALVADVGFVANLSRVRLCHSVRCRELPRIDSSVSPTTR